MLKITVRIALILWLLGAPLAGAAEPVGGRSSAWAQPIQMSGVPNFHKVSEVLYRSAQPTDVGMRTLQQMGIKTVVNLRSFHSDRDEIAGTHLRYEHISMKAWHPEKEDVIRFLRIVCDRKRTPVLVHCQHGADRTGVMCALYRVTVQGWSKEQAIQEMTSGGFGFHAIWQNLPGWIQSLDVEAIKREAGITVSTERRNGAAR
jgi:protein tyrosine phosphatase (PTP) superfamily phosphohydrolase (DUF442 family)